MKPEHLKLAGIATLVCGAMSSLGAEAATSDASALATGKILSLRNMLKDAAPGMTDDTVQDTEPVVAQGDVPDVAPGADAGVAPATDVVAFAPVNNASDVMYTARTAVGQSQDSGEAPIAVPESARVPFVPDVTSTSATPADEDVPVASAVPLPVVTVVAEDQAAPVTNAVREVARAQKGVTPSADSSEPLTMSAAPDPHQVDAVPTVSAGARVAEPVTAPVTRAARSTQAVPVASTDDAAPLTHTVAKTPPARVAGTPRVSVSVAVPVMSTMSASAPVADAPDASAKGVLSTAESSFDIVRNADSRVAPTPVATRTVSGAAPPVVAHPDEASAVTASGDGMLQRAAVSLKSTVDLTAQPAKPLVTKHDDADPAWASADLVAVDSERLDSMRGGFDLPSGLVVSFGISRAAFVNGNLVSSTSFNIPNIAQMTPQQAQMLANANTGAVVQNGLNNTVQPGALPGLTGSVIQNSLNNQQVQALTTINTTVNSLAAFKAFNIGSTVNSALATAVRPR